MSSDCKEFIEGCLEKNPTKRLGQNGVEEILKHSWFSDMCIEDML